MGEDLSLVTLTLTFKLVPATDQTRLNAKYLEGFLNEYIPVKYYQGRVTLIPQGVIVRERFIY